MANNSKILIVEDTSLITDRLITAISEINESEIVGSVDNSMEAIEMYFELHPDIVILDLMLKSGTGFEVLENIKSRHASSIVIVFSNHGNTFIKQSCMDAGADYFLDKSKDFEKLLVICSDIIKNRIPESSTTINQIVSQHSKNMSFLSNNIFLSDIHSQSRTVFNLMQSKIFKFTFVFLLIKVLVISLLLESGLITKNQISQAVANGVGNMTAILMPVNISVFSLPFYSSLPKAADKNIPVQSHSCKIFNNQDFTGNVYVKLNSNTILAEIEIAEFSEFIHDYIHSITSDPFLSNKYYIFPEIDASKVYSDLKYSNPTNNFSSLVALAESLSEY